MYPYPPFVFRSLFFRHTNLRRYSWKKFFCPCCVPLLFFSRTSHTEGEFINFSSSRMWFSEDQRTALEKYYQDWDGVGEVRKEDIDKLIIETGLTRLQVRGWLRNRKNRGSYKGRVIYHPNQVKALEWIFVKPFQLPSLRFEERSRRLHGDEF